MATDKKELPTAMVTPSEEVTTPKKNKGGRPKKNQASNNAFTLHFQISELRNELDKAQQAEKKSRLALQKAIEDRDEAIMEMKRYKTMKASAFDPVVPEHLQLELNTAKSELNTARNQMTLLKMELEECKKRLEDPPKKIVLMDDNAIAKELETMKAELDFLRDELKIVNDH